MAWETVEFIKPKYDSKPALGEDSCRIASRCMGKTKARYLMLSIGKGLAKKASFVGDVTKFRLMLGSGSDAGLIKIQVDATAGDFVAKRSKSGQWNSTLNAKACDGLFSTTFNGVFDNAEVIRPDNGQPVYFTFRAPAALFADDDGAEADIEAAIQVAA
jgi:hypothetical protein